VALARDHAKNDARRDALIEKLQGQLDVALTGWKVQTETNRESVVEWRKANARRPSQPRRPQQARRA
jgi:hypothetical protein